LFNWLYARHTGGQFILRIEDTDRERYVPGSVENILEALTWYGLKPDFGPSGPDDIASGYVQSGRLEEYRRAVLQLVEAHQAYYCFCSSERLEEVRQKQTILKQPPHYDRLCRSIDPAEAKTRADTEKHVIRAAIPESGAVTFTDQIYGEITVEWSTIDDQVLLKSDGYPTYHLANVVDDHAMEISHVIRGEEWLPSVPKHLFLYQAFGWTPPVFAHLPLIFGPDKKKLSKRHGARPALEYRELGYLPEAVLNYLVFLGWNPKTDQELFTLDDLVKAFSLEAINKANPVFDAAKLDWFNGKYIRETAPADLIKLVMPSLETAGNKTNDQAFLEAAINCVRDRLVRLTDIPDAIGFFQTLPDYSSALLIPKQGSVEKTLTALQAIHDHWSTLQPWDEETLRESTEKFIEASGMTKGECLWPARVALSGQKQSPGVFEIAVVLGQPESLKRLLRAIQRLEKGS